MKRPIVGDIVVLKTGSPRMTVTKLGNNKCECMFFDDTRLNHVKLPYDSLDIVTEATYDEGIALPEKKPFEQVIRDRDDFDASELVDESTMTVLTKYIEEDQSKVLAKVGTEIVFKTILEEPTQESSHE